MDNFIGEIRPFAGNYAPEGWHLCDGALLPVAGNEPLYSLVGTHFGGDGVSNFGLPDLRGRLPIGSGQGPGLSNHPFAASGGLEQVVLAKEQMPAHSHAFTVVTGSATASAPNGMMYANPDPNTFYATTPIEGSAPQVLKSDSVSMAGGALAHENRMPTLVINYIIALTGLYPVRA